MFLRIFIPFFVADWLLLVNLEALDGTCCCKSLDRLELGMAEEQDLRLMLLSSLCTPTSLICEVLIHLEFIFLKSYFILSSYSPSWLGVALSERLDASIEPPLSYAVTVCRCRKPGEPFEFFDIAEGVDLLLSMKRSGPREFPFV